MPLLTVKAGDVDYERWRSCATAAGLDLSKWVRHVLNEVSAAETTVVGGGAAAEGGDGVGSFPPPTRDERSTAVPSRRSAPSSIQPEQRKNRSAPPVALHRQSPLRSEPQAPRPRRAHNLGQVARSEGSADPGAGVSERLSSPSGESVAHEAVTAPAPANPSTCPHPRDRRQIRPWGVYCGACGHRVG